ncbi:STM3941 family protein [Gulosibacter molinativorax]|uniref:Uncharacterized protein n=1 Tax=Gulosibacter molinativorax TaxID=256821 RepID=A0ABT7C3U0_9MICO|nr:STM3941 family protein [Gulosibacter molinativorax]MDJ1369908.1 hypothetical protein [Gulosibacter molinativorax]
MTDHSRPHEYSPVAGAPNNTHGEGQATSRPGGERPGYFYQLKRGKIIGLMVLAVLFVVVSALLFFWALGVEPGALSGRDNGRRITALIVGPIGVLLFGLGLFEIIRNFVRNGKRPGLELRPEGFAERTSSAAPNGLVPWTEVQAFAFMTISRQRFLVFVLTDPERFKSYIGTNKLKQMAFAANHRMYGPIHAVALNNLKASPDDLVEAIPAVTQGAVRLAS